MFDGALREASGGILIAVVVRPGAAVTRIAGSHEGWRSVRVDVAARAEKGDANRELAAFLGRLVGVRAVRVVRGLGSRHKTLLVPGVAREAVLAALARGMR